MSEETATVSQQFVMFKLANEFYAVDIASVREIITLRPITRVPRAPEFVEGVINLRGRVIPVIDLRKRMGFGIDEGKRSTRIVVVEVQSNTVGMMVDGVSEVLRISTTDIQAVPSSILNRLNSAFLKGVAKMGERLIILLDLEEVLSEKEVDELKEKEDSLFEESEVDETADEAGVAV